MQNSQWSFTQMILHILISAINGNQRSFFKSFFKVVKPYLPKEDRIKIEKMARIKFFKWYKLKMFKNQYNLLKSHLIKEGWIGKYTTTDA